MPDQAHHPASGRRAVRGIGPKRLGPGFLGPDSLGPVLLGIALLGALIAVAVPAAAAPAAAGPDGHGPHGEAPQRTLTAAILVVNGVYNSEMMAPYDVLQHTRFHTDPWIDVFTVSPDGGPVTTFEGLRVTPDHGFEDAPPVDILIVPSAEGSMTTDLDDERMIGWVRRTGEHARFVMSLCDGAFVLARAGLLDGHAATTFPTDLRAFADRFPAVDLKINVSFVQDGRLLTSQGGAKSYDVAMHLVDLLYGEEVAEGVGDGLLIPWPPAPGAMPSIVVDPSLAPAPEHRHEMERVGASSPGKG